MNADSTSHSIQIRAMNGRGTKTATIDTTITANGYRSGYYGPRGISLVSILLIVLVVFLVMGGGFGGFGHGVYFR